MHRRNMLWGAVSAIGAAFAASRTGAAAEPAAQARLKVVYHLNDLDKVNFVLGNIQNHLDGVGGPDHVTIALVVHGQALKAFHAASASPDLSRRVGQFCPVRPRTCRLRQHHEVTKCQPERYRSPALSAPTKAGWSAPPNC